MKEKFTEGLNHDFEGLLDCHDLSNNQEIMTIKLIRVRDK